MRLIIKIILLFFVIFLAVWLLVHAYYSYAVLLAPVFVFQLVDFYRLFTRLRREVEDFSQAVFYRDFSRYFNVNERHIPSEITRIRKGFNIITDTFRQLNYEKELQYQYLQKIIELVDTGIMSYEIESGNIIWMNEAVKNILHIPFLKTIASLKKRNRKLYDEIVAIKAGEHKLITISRDYNHYKTLLTASYFQVESKAYRLIALQNVNDTLDEAEVKAWQKLLSVMTHEIMNSVAPISSLADTLKNRLSEETFAKRSDSDLFDDIQVGIDTIGRRSEGLLRFAKAYRNLNKIGEPNLATIYMRDLFENLRLLLQAMMLQKNIVFDIILPDSALRLQMDVNLIEQALINLLTNAMEAVKEVPSPRISLSANKDNKGKVSLRVTDNGTGIPTELMERIFIPFFSTRKNGSGIGLSLCQQIMLLHKGSVQVHSIVGQGTSVGLLF